MSHRSTLTRCRELRKSMPSAELILWSRVRRGGLGVRIRRQHSIGPFIVDFACLKPKVAIEIDGPSHDGDEAVVRDVSRSAFLQSRGWKVMRVTNEEIYENLDGVLEAVSRWVKG
jgi:very-short-patch-repair endonuclease